MTISTETDEILEGVCELGIVEFPYWFDMMDIRFVLNFIASYTAVLARVIVAFQRFSFYGSPSAVVWIFSILPLRREPLVEAVPTTKPNRIPFDSGFENS